MRAQLISAVLRRRHPQRERSDPSATEESSGWPWRDDDDPGLVIRVNALTNTVTISGDLVAAGADRIQRTVRFVLQICPAEVTLDLSRLTCIDTAGLRSISQARDHTAGLGQVLHITAAPTAARRISQACGFGPLLGPT